MLPAVLRGIRRIEHFFKLNEQYIRLYLPAATTYKKLQGTLYL